MKKTWVAFACAVILAGAVGIYFFGTGESTQKRAFPENQGGREGAAQKPASTATETATPEQASGPPRPVAKAATKITAEAGPGRVFGKITTTGAGPKTGDITVALHRMIASAEGPGTVIVNTLVATVMVGADRAFDFTLLPLGPYVLQATGDGVAGTVSAIVTADAPEDEVSIALARTASLSGRVVNGAKEGVAGAMIFVAGQKGRGHTPFREDVAASFPPSKTGAAGDFTVEHLQNASDSETYRFAVIAPGYAALVTDYIRPGATPVEWVLSAGTVVSGTLVDAATGEALADKKLVFGSDVAIAAVQTKTDAGGFFFISNAAPGPRTVRLLDDRMVITPDTENVTIAAGAPTNDVVLRAASGGRVAGRVFDKDSGAGIAGVHITATVERDTQGPDESRTSRTDASGAYKIEGLSAATYTVRCDPPDGYPHRSDQARGYKIVARSGNEVFSVDFELHRGVQIRGVVVDESDRPVAGAWVSGFSSRGRAHDDVQTKADGSFALAGFSPGQKVRVSGEKKGLALVKSEPPDASITITDGDVDGVKFVFGKGAQISGLVVDSKGKPKGNVSIQAQAAQRNVGRFGSAFSEADGSFVVDGLAPGEYVLNAGESHSFRPDPKGQKVKVGKGEIISGVRLVVADAGGASISGRVEDSHGRPIANAQISSFGGVDVGEAESDTEGKFSLGGLKDGKYQISASHESFSASQPISAVTGTTDLKIVLKDSAVIEGRVVSAASGQPVIAFRVTPLGVNAMFDVSDFTESETFHDADGRFRLEHVNDGTTSLKVSAEGFAEKSATITRVSGGETRRDVVVQLDAGATLTGLVRDAAGKPISGAQISIGSGGPMEAMMAEMRGGQATSAADGSFKLGSLKPGGLDVLASAHNYAAKTVHTNVSIGTDNRVEIVMTAGGAVEGMVTLDGRPISKQSVSAYSMNGGPIEDETDETGHYRLTGLSDGPVHISVSLGQSESGRDQSRQATVKEGAVTRVDFAFASGSCVLEGTIFENEGTPASESMSVELTIGDKGPGAESFRAESDEHGHFIFENLPAGKGQLSIDQERSVEMMMSRKAVTVELPANTRVRQDIFLFGGATVRVRLTGPSATAMMVPVMLLTGKIEISAASMQSLMEQAPQPAAMSMATGGEAVMKGVDPGTYTVFAFVIDPSKMTSPGDVLSKSDFATKVIVVEKDKELVVELGL